MKKRFMVLIMASLTFLLYVYAENISNKAVSDESISEENNLMEAYEETYSDYGNSVYEDSVYEEVPEETVTKAYPFTRIYPFSEERAWVKFDKDDIICTGVIDTEGNLLYESDSEFFYVSQFKDGTAFYRENREETSPCGIIDLDGNVLFDSQITSDGGYLILAYGDGHFFVAQHIRSFDTDEWRYGTIDKDGNVLNEMKPSHEDFRPESWIDNGEKCSTIRYIGENFIVLPSGLYNLSTIHFSPFPNARNGCMEKIIGNFYEGYTVIAVENGNSHFAYTIDSNYENEDLFYETSFGRGGGKYDDLENVVSKIDDFNSDSNYGEGLIFGVVEHPYGVGYYDKDWNLVISLEQYKDNDISGGVFNGGYAPVVMEGADGDWYASIIDKQGNLLYTPVRIDNANPNNSAKGYLQATIDRMTKIIGPDGVVYTPGVDDLSMLDGFAFGDVGDGLICINDKDLKYVSLDGSKTIDCAKLTDKGSSDTAYIVPDFYDITGKWKSIGDDGFGQAQPGAIIVFDGTRCNFYSPNDTYAFYKEDDRYVLDITSVLGESLSQTVNIIDDNNIDIAGASLRRIE